MSDLEPREKCPKCGGNTIIVESTNPLEEHCIEFLCDYYRAEMAGGGTISE